MGIKLIPVAASGVGGDHIEASVGQYKVEQLNDLLVRLISEYTE